MWKVAALFQGVCYCAVLSVVRKMSEAKMHVSMEQRIIIKFLTKESCNPSEIFSRLKKQYGEKTLSNVSVYKWSSAFKKGRETVENEPHERRPRTSITGENRDRVDALIREKHGSLCMFDTDQPKVTVNRKITYPLFWRQGVQISTNSTKKYRSSTLCQVASLHIITT